MFDYYHGRHGTFYKKRVTIKNRLKLTKNAKLKFFHFFRNEFQTADKRKDKNKSEGIF
jgi:hypothetical protein